MQSSSKLYTLLYYDLKSKVAKCFTMDFSVSPPTIPSLSLSLSPVICISEKNECVNFDACVNVPIAFSPKYIIIQRKKNCFATYM